MSESADGCHIVSRDDAGVTIIWQRKNRAIVWKSKNIERASQNDVTDGEKRSEADAADGEDAFENEISGDGSWQRSSRSCCQHTPHLWPHFSPAYSTELYLR